MYAYVHLYVWNEVFMYVYGAIKIIIYSKKLFSSDKFI